MSIYKPSSRQELIDYCLRQLGEPVLEINIDPDQIEDRVEEALQYYQEFHVDGTEQIYLSAQITASTLNLQSNNGNVFIVGDVITGSNTSATCVVHSLNTGNVVTVKNITGTFEADEPITSDKSVQTGQLASTLPVVKGSYDNKYFEIEDDILNITKALPLSSTVSGSFMFDINYQMMLNSLPTLTSLDLGYYTQLKAYLNTINDTLVGQKPIRFRRHMNRLYLDWSWSGMATIGNYVVVEAYRLLDPETYTDVYNDMWLKRYLTQLIKLQWGLNMKKFSGIQLPGGVMMNGQIIYDEAVAEIEALQKECQDTWQSPVDFFVG